MTSAPPLEAPDDDAHAAGVLPFGTLVGDRYVAGRLLGRGAMGLVFEGTHRDLDERVAIKVLLPEHLANAELVARFAREARAAVRLRGEYVARVLDVGKHDGSLPYIVMEYLDGEDLGHVVERRGPLPVAEACGYVIEACAGLAEAHARGVVHRDVKPENLFLAQGSDGRSRVKILDFGVSKVALTGTAMPDVDLAATSTMLGTPLYMSPEQIRSREVDHRSDIWSLGVVLYELLTARTPFVSTNIAELVSRVLEEPPLPVRHVRPDLPEALERAVMRCLARDPAWRWDSVAALAMALLPFAPPRSRSVAEQARVVLLHADETTSFPELLSLAAAPISLPPPAPSAEPSGVPVAAPPPPVATRTPSVSHLWAIAAVLATMLALALAVLLRSPEPPRAATRPAPRLSTVAAAPAVPTSDPSSSPDPAAPPPTPSASSQPKLAEPPPTSEPQPPSGKRGASPATPRPPAALETSPPHPTGGQRPDALRLVR